MSLSAVPGMGAFYRKLVPGKFGGVYFGILYFLSPRVLFGPLQLNHCESTSLEDSSNSGGGVSNMVY